MSASDGYAHQPDTDVTGVPVIFANQILRIDGMGSCAQITLGISTEEESAQLVPQVIVVWPVDALPAAMTLLGQWLLARAARAARLACEKLGELLH